MKVLRRLSKILKLIPGKAQHLWAWFLSMQYWLGGSDDKIEGLIRSFEAQGMRVIPAFADGLDGTPGIETFWWAK